MVNSFNDFFFLIVKVSLKNAIKQFFFVTNTKSSFIQKMKNLEAYRKKTQPTITRDGLVLNTLKRFKAFSYFKLYILKKYSSSWVLFFLTNISIFLFFF